MKKASVKTVRVQISLPEDWIAEGQRQARRSGRSFSGYVRDYIYRQAPQRTAARLSTPLEPGRKKLP